MIPWARRYGPWAVVTGASEGIGREMAMDLARRGLNLVLVARRAGLLESLGRSLAESGKITARVEACDLGRPAEVERVLRTTQGLDVGLLIACAGFGTSGRFVDADLERERHMLDVNCGAVLHLTHGFAPRMAERGRGGIVLMSSLVGFQGVPRAAHYAATKAYVQTLAEGLRREMAPLGVDVLASAPGPVVTGFGRVAGMKITSGVPAAVVARETLDALGRRGTVRPGWLSKALEASLATLPRSLRVLAIGQVMAGMTRDPRPASTPPPAEAPPPAGNDRAGYSLPK